MWNGIHDLPGVHVLEILMMTKAWLAQVGWPWTTYLLADVRILKPYTPLVTCLERRWWGRAIQTLEILQS